MTDTQIIAQTEQDTADIARKIALNAKNGDIYCLHGDLGAGKTSFSRAFIQSLTGNTTEVPSPTFTLVQTYDTERFGIWHFDLYRLEDPEEIYELGWEEALSNNVLLIEWPEKGGSLIPNTAKHIYITINDNQTRTIRIEVDHNE